MQLTEYEKLQEAVELAFNVHQDQTRYDGTPYIFHPLQVMLNVKSMKAKTVAVLHDVLEDSPVLDEMYGYIYNKIDPDIASIVKILTKNDGEDYDSYIKNVCNNPIAVEVKIADINHNLSQLPFEEKYNERRRKYVKARGELEMSRLPPGIHLK